MIFGICGYDKLSQDLPTDKITCREKRLNVTNFNREDI